MKRHSLNMIAFALFTVLPVAAFCAEIDSYYQHLHTQVLPYVQAHLKHERVKAHDGVELNYAVLKVANSKGTVFLSPGRSESVLGQTELIYEIAQAGYSVAAIDHRGQGFSERLLKHSDAGHVGKFTDYVRDFRTFAIQVVEEKMPKPYFFLGQSMGAAIGTHFAIINPTFFSRLVVAAPMYRISKHDVVSNLIYGAAKSLYILGWGDTLAPSTKPYDFNAKFAGNRLTHSIERFKFDVWLTKQNPEIAVGGPTTNWVLEASRETTYIKRNAAKIKTPLLIIQAGGDAVVSNRAQYQVCLAAKQCRIFRVPGAYHNIFMESDQYRGPAVRRAIRFFNEAEVRPSQIPAQVQNLLLGAAS